MTEKQCTQHPDCKGPSLIEGHAEECPFGRDEDCDNETCWVPCAHCEEPENWLQGQVEAAADAYLALNLARKFPAEVVAAATPEQIAEAKAHGEYLKRNVYRVRPH